MQEIGLKTYQKKKKNLLLKGNTKIIQKPQKEFKKEI